MSAKRKPSTRSFRASDEVPELDAKWIAGADYYEGIKLVRRGRSTGPKARPTMSKRIKYKKGPIGDVKIVEDFLPPPSELVLKEEVEKVTISLSKRSVDFFKGEAKRNGTQYQRMIRALLERYAQLNEPSNKRMQRGGQA
jgi:predicted DNA binding CopG/RHH family protein